MFKKDGSKKASDESGATEREGDSRELDSLAPQYGVEEAGSPSGRDAEAPSSPEELAKEYLDQLQRLKAEFDNYRRRIAREREEWFLSARLDVVRQLLPVLDDLGRAREHDRAYEEAPETAGLLLVLKRLEDILTQLGLEKQEASTGQEFDPESHEAVMTSPSEEIAEGGILQTIEPGYLFQGRLLRPSKVLVSSGPAPE